MVMKHCPNCGNEINDEDVEFCTECGCSLSNSVIRTDDNSKGFFDNLKDKTSFPVIVFSFVVFGVFLFVGALFWSSFMANGTIDLITYLLLTVVFSVFFGGIFAGYFGCKDESYVVPNISMYLGSIFAVVLCGIGLIFTFLMGILSALSSVFSSTSGSSSYGSAYQPATSSFTPSADLSFIFKIILFILLIPLASYLGVYLGYFLKQNI